MNLIKILDTLDKNSIWSKDYLKYREYLESLTNINSRDLIKNANAKVKILQIGDDLYPLCIIDPDLNNSYIFSSVGTILLAKELYIKNNNKKLIPSVLDAVSLAVSKSSIDKVVLVDNWCFFPTPPSNIKKDDLKNATQFLIKQFPEHSICFEVNSLHDSDLLNNLKNIGYKKVPWKNSIVFNTKNDFKLTHSSKNDLRLKKRCPLQIVGHNQITPSDYPRILELYNMLFLQKYSSRGAQITEKFIQICHENSILNFIGLRNKEGVLEGFTTIFARNEKMANFLTGYNLELPQELGVYRILMGMVLQYAIDNKMLFNAGMGATKFKQFRGGVVATDFLVYYDTHLSRKRRCFDTFFNCAIRIFAPFFYKE